MSFILKIGSIAIMLLLNTLSIYGSTFKIVYNFNTNKAIVESGSEAITAYDATFGGNYLKNTAFESSSSDFYWKGDVVNNNATNYVNTFLRCDIKPINGYSLNISKITAIQRSIPIGTSNLFRIGCTKNGATPNNTNISESTDNINFTSDFSSYSFVPGKDVATSNGIDLLSVFLCARGSSTATVSWNVDQIEITGTYQKGEIQPTITVSNTPKQQLRFGVDAERLWYWRSSLKDQLASLAVSEMKSDYVRIAINCAYEREEGVLKISTYEAILEMMTAMKKANPQIKLFASPRPLAEAYNTAELQTYWGGSDVPWSPYPTWVLPFTPNGTTTNSSGAIVTKWKEGSLNVPNLIRYLSDYLNLMHERGFEIDYLDLTNEKNVITPSITKYVFDNIASHLSPGVKKPLFIVPSTWSRQQGTDWLNSVNRSNGESNAFAIAATHNTDPAGTAAAFSTAANALGKEVWNTELHGWVGIALRDEILNSAILWEHLREGFQGIDSWLFFGPYNGKDHTMIWSNTSQIIKSGKYEIFKKLVNNANRGYYLDATNTISQIPTSAFIKDSILTVWILNPSSLKIPNTKIEMPGRNISGLKIETTCWKETYARSGSVSSITATDSNSFSFDLDSAALYCFRVNLLEKVNAAKHVMNTQSMKCIPNPTSGIFSIESNSPLGVINYSIFDSHGQLHSEGVTSNSSEIDLTGAKQGLYIVKANFKNEVFVDKIIIRK